MIILKKNEDFFSFGMGRTIVPIEESLIPHLVDEIVLEEGVTFGQFFNILLKHHEEYSEFFSSYMGGIPLSDYIKEFNLVDKKSKGDPDINYVCSRWGTTYVFSEDVNRPIYVKKIPEFIGFRNNQTPFGEGGYSLEFTPLNKLKKYPFKLIKNEIIADSNSGKIIFTLEKDFTVLDVLISIFNEITLMGTPNEKEETYNKLMGTIKKSHENFNEERQKSITWEKFLRKMKIDPSKKN